MNEHMGNDYYVNAYRECYKAVAYVYLKLAIGIYQILKTNYAQNLKNRADDDIITLG